MRQQESANIVDAGQDWKECFARDNVLHVDVLNMEWDQIRNSAKCTSRQKTNSRRFSAGRFLVIPAGARSCAEQCPEHVHRHTPALAGQKVALVRGVTLCGKTPALTGQEVALVRGVTLCGKTPARTGQDLFIQYITRREYINEAISLLDGSEWLRLRLAQ